MRLLTTKQVPICTGSLVLAAILAPLIFNLFWMRRDLKKVYRLRASRNAGPLLTPAEGGLPMVSVLLAAWNEEAALASSVEAVRALRYPRLEVVLCAGGTDRTWEIAEGLAADGLILLKQYPGEGKQKSLQRCFEQSSGEIVYLLDAGTRITDAAFAAVLGPILSGREQAVTSSPCTPLPGQSGNPFVVSQCATRVYTSLRHPVYCSGLLGASAAVRRSALEQAGAFDPAVRAGGDFELGQRLLRMGVRIRYEVEGTFPFHFHTQLRSYIRQQSRWIRNVVVHGVRFGAYGDVARSLLTSAVGLTMLALPLAGLLLAIAPGAPPDAALFCAAVWLLAFLHALLSRIRYVIVASNWIGFSAGPRILALVPFYLLVDFVAWTRPLFEYPSRTLRERW